MSATLTQPDTFHFTYDTTAKLMRGCWPAPVADVVLRGHYAELLAHARQYGRCRYWLLDMDQRQWHSPSFGAWFGTEFAATAEATLSEPIFIAYVLNPCHRAVAESAGTQATQRACARHGVYPYFFASEAEALDWLRYQQGLH